MSASVKGFQFGDFVLDCEEQALFFEGNAVPLTPKAYLLLKTLVENSGRVVEKGELMETVWPDSFVEEGNLPFTAFSLRKALGDNKDEPRFIETVPRRGYRFIAPVTPIPVEIEAAVEDGPVREQAALDPAIGPHSWWRSVPAKLAAAGAAALLVAGGIWFVTRAGDHPSASILSRPFAVEQLSTSGKSAHAALSPDGKFVVYSEESGGKESVWLRNLDSSENVQIVPPSDDEYLGLTFASTGNFIYFVRLAHGLHGLPSLYRIDTVGGVPVKLADNVGKRVSLSADDSRIAFARCRYRRTDFCGVFVADANGANERKLMATENGIHIGDVRFAPDGRSIAVSTGRASNEMNDAAVFEINVETAEQRPMFTERFAEVPSLEWVPDGSGILFSASDFQEGKASIYFADRRSGSLEQLTRDAASYQTLTLDRASDRLLAVQRVPDYRLNVVSGGAPAKLAVAREVAAMPGGRLAYSTFDGEIWSVNMDGTEQRQLTRSRSSENSICVSADGKYIYFSTDESGKRHVWGMNSDGSDRRQITHDAGGFPLSVTADGKQIFYEATLDSLLRRVAADGSGEASVHDRLLSNPEVSPDGTRAAYFFTEGMVRKLAVMDLSTKQNVKVLEAPEGASFNRPMAWAADGRELYYTLIADGRNTLWRTGLDAAAPMKIADIGDEHVLDVTPVDNGGFAYVSGGWRFDVMLIRGLG
ncbi:MAG: winged helix-turn-helix domain-containing protein [Pyrinomonadaceae bacterium]